MLYSMTGFATTTITLKTERAVIPLTLTLKTLNNRFLDINCKLPSVVTHLEPDIIKKCKQKLARGAVYFVLYINNPQTLKSTVVPSLTIAEGYLQGIRKIQETLQLPGQVSIEQLLSLPDLFTTTEDFGNIQEQSAIILDAVDALLNEVVTARAHEGVALAQDITERMRIIQTAIDQIEPRILEVGEERKQHFLQEISEVLANTTPETKEMHVQALYHSLDKIDVHEEIVRFKNHHANFLATLRSTEEQKGKKLDFIIQELLREINTLNAKVPDALTSNPVITIKVELEKAREQVQNIV